MPTAVLLLFLLADQHAAEYDMAGAVGPRVDAGSDGGPHFHCSHQLLRPVLLLLGHRLLWPLAEGVLPQRPVLSPTPGPERSGPVHHMDVHRVSH